MSMDQLKIASGTWVVANCANFPSKINCKMVLMTPENQRDDLLDALVDHAIKCHGGTRSDQLRRELNSSIQTISV